MSHRELPRRTFLASTLAIPATGHVLPRDDDELQVTRWVGQGPFFTAGAPFRGKLSPVRAAGTPLVVTGRVLSARDGAPIPGAVLDLWHADAAGEYSAQESWDYRARVATDAEGRYEYETIHPASYSAGSVRRCPHIHSIVTAPGHARLETQLFFEGDGDQDRDPLIEPSLVTPVARGDDGVERVSFDVVLESAKSA